MSLFHSVPILGAWLLGDLHGTAKQAVDLKAEGEHLEKLVASGKHAQADEQAFRSLVSMERNYGHDHPLTAIACLNRATVCMLRGDTNTAKTMIDRALDISTRQRGEKHAETIRARMKLGRWHEAQDNYNQAEQAYQEALGHCKEILGPKDPGLAAIYNCLASLHFRQELYDQAEAYASNAVQVCNEAGQQVTEVVTAHTHLADALWGQRKYEESLKHYEQALEACRSIHGEESSEAARCRKKLAIAIQERGNFKRAEDLLKKALEIQQRLGPNAPEYLTTLACLGKLRFDQGKHQEGLKLIAEAIRSLDSLLGAAHPIVREWKNLQRRLTEQMQGVRRIPGLKEKTRQLIEQLRRTPGILQEVLDELPQERLTQRPTPKQWSASEHVWRIAELQRQTLEVLDQMLAEPGLSIELGDQIDGAMKLPGSAIDVRGSRKRYLTERQVLLTRLERLADQQWLHQARHPQHCRFSVLLLIQQLTLRELHHVYRIGEILLAR